MRTIAMNNLKIHTLPQSSQPAKFTMCYVSAHLTAISAVGLLYLFGIFDVGFLAPESFALKLFEYVNTLAY